MLPRTQDNATKAALPSQRQNQPRSYPHTLLNVFAQARKGSLHLTAPDGSIYDFQGQEPGPQADITLTSWRPFDALITRGDLGFGESYMDGEFTTNDLPALLTFALANNDLFEAYLHGRGLFALSLMLKAMMHVNSLRGSKANIQKHYDLGNQFYELWLDQSMTYSSALFDGHPERTLEEAQKAKYTRILTKLNAHPGDQILEIGCGWGGFAEMAAKQGLKVTSITISEEQARYAAERLQRQNLHQAEIHLTDYRVMDGTFDAIVSIGMFEHVGREYWPLYFRIVHDRLKRGGKAMIQSITLNEDVYRPDKPPYGFIEKYIFPGGILPTKQIFRDLAERAGLICHEQFAFGQDYARTLTEWRKRFQNNIGRIRMMGYDERFIRMWDFYYCACIASFTTHRTDVMQAELSRPL